MYKLYRSLLLSYRIYGWISTGFFIYRSLDKIYDYFDSIRRYFVLSSIKNNDPIEDDWVRIPIEGHPPSEIF